MIMTQKYNLRAAYELYRKFIYNEEHQSLLREKNLRIAGSVHPINWELFSAVLTGDKGKDGYGSDLHNYEVKSSVNGSGFEYQYHLFGGRTKLADDMKVSHIFISYSKDYKDIEVRIVEGKKLKPIFESWEAGLIKNYEGPNRLQRYRRRISFREVVRSGSLILKTQNGQLV